MVSWKRTVLNLLAVVAVILAALGIAPSVNQPQKTTAVASLSRTSGGGGGNPPVDVAGPAAPYAPGAAIKSIDQPNLKDHQRMMERQRLLEAGQTTEAAALAQSGTDRVLVVLTEFAGTDVFTWTAPITPTDPATGSQWDPLGIVDPYEYTGTLGDCSKIITQTKTFTYTGPLHNMIERPRSGSDRSGQSIWSPDFTPQWFDNFMFGNGVVISYTRQDNSAVHEDFSGQSVNQYFNDLSTHAYTITGDVIGWVQVPHSTWYYDADQCPGGRSAPSGSSGARRGVIPGAGTARTLVKDALNAVNAISNTIPGFNWANYDRNGDGVIDRLWIVHAGYGEEDGDVLLNRNPTDPADPTRTTPVPADFYGEAAVWSHSSAVTPQYSVTQNIAAGPYIIMPENGGIGVFAHEYAHNLGADDLYAYGNGETSAGFWALQADDWTGYPIGFEPPAPDPWHLDNWGWLNPFVITDTTKVYTVTLGQASYFNTNTAPGTVYRGAKIELPTGYIPQPVPVWQGSYYWWGGKADLINSMMTTKNPIAIPAGVSNLTFDLVYDLEDEWDFLWIEVSPDGTTWMPLTNTNTSCVHDPNWIGGLYGFPDDLCGAGLGGFTGHNANWPDPQTQVFTITSPIPISGYLRFWYMTDWGTTGFGPFVDNVKAMSGATTLFSDDAEAGDAKWTYADDWVRSNGTSAFTHNFYLQWRNTNANGGYDSALGDSRWRFGPANTGLLAWYNNNNYSDNEVFNYLNEYPGFGPKGRMLVVDSHPDPYREPAMVAAGYNNEAGNVTSRSQMRDAPFTLQNTVGFTYTTVYPAIPFTTTLFTNYYAGRPAVSTFNDAVGYYPGGEFVPGGPVGQTSPRWMTKQWDASAVVPSKEFYGVKAPGYTDGTRFRFGCSFGGTNNAQVLCYSYSTGLGYDGGTGNPGDIYGQYGWHVQLIEEAADHTWAKVKIWNAMKAADQTYMPNKTTTSLNDTVTYNYTFNQNWGSPLSLFACVPLDTTKVEFVPGSGTNGAVALPMSCAAAANALTGDRPLSALAADATATVMAVGWTGGNIGTGVGNLGFGFTVNVKVVTGVLHQSVNLYDNGSLWTTLNANDVTVVPAFKVFLPLVVK